jgi:chaperonin GroEL (HSP60 family)
LLLQAITAGANPIAVKKGIDKTQEYLVQKLRENAKPVNGRNDIRVRLHLACIVVCKSACELTPMTVGCHQQAV